MNVKKILLVLAIITLFPLNAYAKKDDIYIPKNFPKKYDKEYVIGILPVYKSVSKEPVVAVAMDMLVGTNGEFSRNAILGNNLSQRPMKVEFKNLSEIKADYANYDESTCL
jgi:hypothetical protein